jgi:hypothetical protein
MRVFRIPLALGVVLILVAATSWILAWPFEKALFLAPVIVVCGAAVVGLLILWGKIAFHSLKESRRPGLVLGLWVAGIVLLVLLTILGVDLPREG